jgi:hypothetical protein
MIVCCRLYDCCMKCRACTERCNAQRETLTASPKIEQFPHFHSPSSFIITTTKCPPTNPLRTAAGSFQHSTWCLRSVSKLDLSHHVRLQKIFRISQKSYACYMSHLHYPSSVYHIKSYSVHNFFHAPVTSFILGANAVFSNLVSSTINIQLLD